MLVLLVLAIEELLLFKKALQALVRGKLLVLQGSREFEDDLLRLSDHELLGERMLLQLLVSCEKLLQLGVELVEHELVLQQDVVCVLLLLLLRIIEGALLVVLQGLLVRS